MAKKIARENILFDFDDIQHTFYPESTYNPPEENPDISKNLRCIKDPRKPPGNRARKVIKGLPKCLGLPQIREFPNKPTNTIVRHESPWDTYRRIGVCEISGEVIVAADRSRSSRLRTFREYGKADADKLIHHLRNFDHLNILTAEECYLDQSSMYVLVEHLPLTLNDLVCCRAIYPNEAELASIMSQVGFYLMRHFSIS